MWTKGTIIALDLASVTGWALWRPTGEIASGSKRLGDASTSDGRFFAAFDEWLSNMVTLEQPGALIFEAPILRAGSTALQTARRLMGLAVLADLIGYRREIPLVREEHLQSVKAHFAGNGRADKRAMMEACRARGWKPKDDNEADALALLDLAMHKLKAPGTVGGPLLARAG